jgi:hypothetical protein
MRQPLRSSRRPTAPRKTAALFCGRIAPPGLEPKATCWGEPQAGFWAQPGFSWVQRGRYNHLNSSNLLPFTRVRVTRCWSLLGFMLDFAVLYSLKCRSCRPRGMLVADSSNSWWPKSSSCGVMSISGTPERRMGRAGHQGRSQP